MNNYLLAVLLVIFVPPLWIFARVLISGIGKMQANQRLQQRLQQRVPGRYELSVVGEQYEGRQKAVRRCRVGETVALQREPKNQYDRNAVAVLNGAGKQIGYIPKEKAEWVAEILDRGEVMTAEVTKVYDNNGFTNVMIAVNIVSRQKAA